MQDSIKEGILLSVVINNEKLLICMICVLYLMSAVGISSTLPLVIVIVVTIFIALQKGLYVPKTMNLYLLWGLLAIIIGIFYGYSARYILRATFYFLNGLAPILFALQAIQIIDKKKLLRVLLIIQVVITIYCFIRLLFWGTLTDSSSIRTYLSTDLYSLEFLYPLYLFDVLVFKKEILSKRIDILVVILFSLRILLSFSRTTIVCVAVALILYYFLLEKEVKYAAKKIVLIGGIILGMIVGISFLFELSPNSMFIDFLDKLSSSGTEISTANEYNSYEDAIDNWRGYETKEAIEQWSESSFIEQFLGIGFGGLIKMQYISTDWSSFEFYNKGAIPILHNGYATILCLGGIFGLIALLVYFGGEIIQAFRIRSGGRNDSANKCIVLVVMMMCNMYIVNGLYSQSIQLTWGIMLICLSEMCNDGMTYSIASEDEYNIKQ